MSAVKALSLDVGVTSACEALSVNRSQYYRHLQPKAVAQSRPEPPLKLSKDEHSTSRRNRAPI